MCTHTLNNAQPHSENSWWVYLCVCGGALKCARGSHACVSAGSSFFVSQDFFPSFQFLSKACSVKWRENTRESIIQLSRFPLSLQTEENWGSDRLCWCGGAGERDRFYQHKLCLIESTVLSVLLAVAFSGTSVRLKQKDRGVRGRERSLEDIQKLLSNIELVEVLLVVKYVCVCVCVCALLTWPNQNNFNNTKQFPWCLTKLLQWAIANCCLIQY